MKEKLTVNFVFTFAVNHNLQSENKGFLQRLTNILSNRKVKNKFRLRVSFRNNASLKALFSVLEELHAQLTGDCYQK